MKTYSITMTVSVNVTVEATSAREAAQMAVGIHLSDVSEFGRTVEAIEDITPVESKVRKGVGSY